MGKAKDEAGNIWETDATGNPVRLLQPASNGMGPAIGNDPRVPFQTQKAQNDAAASVFAAPKARADTVSAQADAAFARQVAEAQARKAEADARTAEANANSGSAKAATTVRAEAIAGYQSAQQLYKLIDELNAKFLAGPGKTSGMAGVRDYLPLTENQQFDRASAAARGIVGQALGFTGGQLNTEREAEKAVGPYLPESGDRDEIIRDKIARLSELAKSAETRSISVLGGRPDPNGNIVPVEQEALPSVPDQMQFSKGGTRTEVDEFRKAVMGRASQMITQGRPRSEVEKYVRDNGLEPRNFDNLYQFRQSPDFNRWQRANPGKALPLDPNGYTREVPLSARERQRNSIGQSAPGAFVASAANAISGNHLDDIAGAVGGNAAAVNTGLALNQSAHPGASFMGDVAGQAMAEATIGRIPGFRALYGKRFGQMGMDALYGGYAGSGSEDGNILSGAVGNVAGGALFRGGSRAIGSGVRGINTPSLRYLNERDVPLTIGQIGRGSDSTAGHALGGIEERMAGLPITDAIIGSARQRGDVGFNKEMFRQIGEPVGDPGAGNYGVQGLTDARSIRNRAYSFLDGASMPRDPQYDAGDAALTLHLPKLPDFGVQVGRKQNLVNGAFENGQLSGRNWQSSMRSIRGDRGKIGNQPFGQEAADALGMMETNLTDLAARQVPGASENLANANAVNANFKTVQAALKGRVAQRNGVLTDPITLADKSIAGATKFGGVDRALEGNRPFFDLTTAGSEVMPNLTPDSGTAGRSLFYAALPGLIGGGGIGYGASGDGEGAAQGAGVGAGTTLLPTLALMALYSRGGQKGLQKALLGPRSAHTEQVGSALLDPAVRRLFGMFGSATARDLLLNPELPAN